MNINHNDTGTEGAFSITKEGTQAALLTYTKIGNDRISLDHTEVNASLRGEGAGKELVKAAVDFARKSNLKIVPKCPFAAHVFEEEKDWQDVL